MMNEWHEYKVLIFDPEKVKSLNDEAKDGWRVCHIDSVIEEIDPRIKAPRWRALLERKIVS